MKITPESEWQLEGRRETRREHEKDFRELVNGRPMIEEKTITTATKTRRCPRPRCTCGNVRRKTWPTCDACEKKEVRPPAGVVPEDKESWHLSGMIADPVETLSSAAEHLADRGCLVGGSFAMISNLVKLVQEEEALPGARGLR